MKVLRCRTQGAVLLALAVACFAGGVVQAAPAADCNGQLNVRYVSGPAFGVDGSVYRVEIGLGTGTITDGVANTLSLSSVRFFLDCTFSGLPGCVDDGNVVAFAGNISTTCGTQQSDFWDPAAGANFVDFNADAPVVIPALTPAFPGFCVLQFDIVVAEDDDARDDTTPNRVEEIGQYTVGTCDNGLPTSGSQSSAFNLCPVCNDLNFCTGDSCDTATGVCVYTPNVTCDDLNACTTDVCNPATGTCTYTPSVTCDDGDACTSDVCNPATGTCVYTPVVVCDDGDGCTSDVCNPATGTCVYTPNVTCDDDNACTSDLCNPATGTCVYTPVVVCDDGDGCTSDVCNPATGNCVYTPNVTCDDSNVCTSDVCNPATGTCVYTPDVTCDDGSTCTEDVCDPVEGCVYTPADPLPEECTLPCRITAGGIVPTDTGGFITDPTLFAKIERATFGGQVGAPFGLVGCHDDFDSIQGQWTHMRHSKRGTFHASDYTSLTCGCDDGLGGPGVFDGRLCNPDDREPGPEPRPAPANIACFTGVGDWFRTNGRRTVRVAFRVNVEDRGEPGAGDNAGTFIDEYRIEIWIPEGNETAEGLAALICCVPDDIPDPRPPDITDGGELIRGNIQIHPPTGHPNNP